MVLKAFFLFNLPEGKTVEEYERWTVEVNHPASNRMNTITEFHDYKAVDTKDGSPPAYQIIEEVLITDIEEYKKELTAPERAGFSKEWFKWVKDDWFCIITERIA